MKCGNYKGGYAIIDFKGLVIGGVDDTPVKFKGIHNKVMNLVKYNKPIKITNLYRKDEASRFYIVMGEVNKQYGNNNTIDVAITSDSFLEFTEEQDISLCIDLTNAFYITITPKDEVYLGDI